MAKQSRSPAAPLSAGGEETTLATKTPKAGGQGTPVWTYVIVGFLFGGLLLGIYRAVMVFSN